VATARPPRVCFGKSAAWMPLGERAALDARLDVLRRRIEGLAQAHVVAAAVVLHQPLDVRRRRDLGALGFSVGTNVPSTRFAA